MYCLFAGLVLLLGCSSKETTTQPPSAPSAPTSAPPASASPSSTTAATPTTAGPTADSTGSTNLPGEAQTEAQRLSPTQGTFSTCKDCHSYLDPPSKPRPALNSTFRHQKHLARGATCESCHRLPVHVETTVNRPGMAECYTCHSNNPGAAAPADCDLCHPASFKTMPTSHTHQFFQGGHAAVVQAQGTKECFVCHSGNETTFCLGCHKLPMPHPEGWVKAADGSAGRHVAEAYAKAQVCVQCHQNKVGAPAGCYGGECHGGK